jgi:hypothetical protein
MSTELKSLNVYTNSKTLWERLDTYDTTNEGKIRVPLVKEGSGEVLFDKYEDYITWKEDKKEALWDKIYKKLTPMEYFITQGKGTERPFTGDYWDTNKVGVYSCKVCTQRIFR